MMPIILSEHQIMRITSAGFVRRFEERVRSLEYGTYIFCSESTWARIEPKIVIFTRSDAFEITEAIKVNIYGFLYAGRHSQNEKKNKQNIFWFNNSVSFAGVAFRREFSIMNHEN